MKSKRIWVAKDYDIGYKSKSHMAEFSPNPDGRNKRDTSIKEYNKRLMMAENSKMTNRVSVNKLRDEKGLAPFLEQNKYEEIVEESELEGQNLFNFLIGYKIDISLEENLNLFDEIIEKNDFPEIISRQDMPYVRIEELSRYLNIDMKKLLSIFKKFNRTFFNDSLPKKSDHYFIYNNDKNSHLISFFYISMLALNEIKKSAPLSLLLHELKKYKLNSSFERLIHDICNGYFRSNSCG